MCQTASATSKTIACFYFRSILCAALLDSFPAHYTHQDLIINIRIHLMHITLPRLTASCIPLPSPSDDLNIFPATLLS